MLGAVVAAALVLAAGAGAIIRVFLWASGLG